MKHVISVLLILSGWLGLGGRWGAGVEGAEIPSPSAGSYAQVLTIPSLNLRVLTCPGCTARAAQAGTVVVTLHQHTGNNYGVLALVPRPVDAPRAGFVYVLSFESRFLPAAAGQKGQLGLGLCDGRGWGPVQSAIAVMGAEKAATWTRFQGTYEPLPDTRSVQIVARIESGATPVSGVWEIRDLRLEARSLPPVVSAAELTKLKKIIVPAQQRQDAPPVLRGFNIGGVDRGTRHDRAFFEDARKWGARLVRLSLDPGAIARDQHQEVWSIWPQILDDVVKEVQNAHAAGIQVVLVLSNPPLANASVAHNSSDLWKQPDLESVFCRVWKDLAQRLLPYHDAIYGYDLYNEPVDPAQMGPPRQWRPIALQIIRTIRAVDPKVWIIYEPGPWGDPAGFTNLVPLPDPRVIYSFHFYEPHAFTHQGVYDTVNTDLAHALTKINVHYPGVIDGKEWNKAALAACLAPIDRFQQEWGVPIFAGEFSAVRWAPDGDAAQWLADVTSLLNQRHWSWCYHAFREWNGWSLEYGNTFWREGMPYPKPVTYETRRAKVIKAALRDDRIPLGAKRRPPSPGWGIGPRPSRKGTTQ